MSMTFAIDAGMASYEGAATEIVADGAGSDAARAAAMDVAAIFEDVLGRGGGMFARSTVAPAPATAHCKNRQASDKQA